MYIYVYLHILFLNIVVENAISAFKWSLKNSLDSGARRTRILVLLGLEDVRNQLYSTNNTSLVWLR